eukprot:CAMPEP_0180685284 /NCGR_PEP_ID=MMETSP1037_2-20121125/72269_1 /TAXON_ID=632150 /ORGANISM="Azadinium spinosum, Strain 3D9" /LENGTH=43 /DNA_ID= /DNA_START= /DNA_END= /DNA_ORIENTATION=
MVSRPGAPTPSAPLQQAFEFLEAQLAISVTVALLQRNLSAAKA